MYWRERVEQQRFLHRRQPRMIPFKCRQPAGFIVSHRTCAYRRRYQRLAHQLCGAEKVLAPKKRRKGKKTFLVTSETEGSVVQLVTVDHQAPPTNKQLTACCVFIFFSRSPSLEHIEDGELVERTTAESSNKF